MNVTTFMKRKGLNNIRTDKNKSIEIGLFQYGENSTEDKIVWEFWNLDCEELDSKYIDKKEMQERVIRVIDSYFYDKSKWDRTLGEYAGIFTELDIDKFKLLIKKEFKK